jgi:hypothetical protein
VHLVVVDIRLRYLVRHSRRSRICGELGPLRVAFIGWNE